jgi:1-acyl-sn-glycerol-3-phosphate acyltransferase
MKIINTILAPVRLVLFGLFTLMQLIALFLFTWMSPKLGNWQFRVYSKGTMMILGIRASVQGKMSDYRPLLLVCNHIGIFELIAFPSVFKCVFFAKGEIQKWFPLNWLLYSFGNTFIDRNPIHARESVDLISKNMENSRFPHAIFPEGTTTNGDYMLPFKSSMFSFIENGGKTKVQPIAVIYRDKHGNKIPPQVLADDYAYFANSKQTQPPYTKKERSVLSLFWKIFIMGGVKLEFYVLPIPETTGLDRKQISNTLFTEISTKFEEMK